MGMQILHMSCPSGGVPTSYKIAIDAGAQISVPPLVADPRQAEHDVTLLSDGSHSVVAFAENQRGAGSSVTFSFVLESRPGPLVLSIILR